MMERLQSQDTRPHVLLARTSPFARFAVPHPQETQLPFALAYLAGGFDEDGWDVSVSDGWLTPQFTRGGACRLAAEPADLGVVLAETTNARDALRLGAVLKERGTRRIVAIGQMATTLPGELLPPNGPYDACVCGEAEETVRELARAVRAGVGFDSVRGVALADRDAPDGVRRTRRRPYVRDLDELPRPRYGRFPLDAYAKLSCHLPVLGRVRWGWLLTSRGCPCGCSFCSPVLRKSFGARYRVHSLDYVVDLVDRLQREHGCNAIAIEDDHFTFDRERTLALCEALARRPRVLPWTAQARIDSLDGELVAALRRAGCAGLCMGIESADPAIRRAFKRCDRTNEEIEATVRLVHAAGIHTTLYFMLGFPGESERQMAGTLALARRLRPLMIQVAFFTRYPGSPAWDEIAGGNGDGPPPIESSHYNARPASTGPAAGEHVRAFQRRFYRSFFFDPRYAWRFATQRLPFTLTQGRELPLVARTLAWLAARRLAG